MPYWRALSDFLAGKMSHAEFEDLALEHLKTPQQSKYAVVVTECLLTFGVQSNCITAC